MRSGLFGVSLLIAMGAAGWARAEGEAPASALSLHDEAKELYAQGRYGEAVDKLEEAIAHDPDAVLLHYNLGLIEEKRGRLDAALLHYRRCLELEQSAAERAQIQKIVERLEGAKAHGVLDAPAPSTPSPPPPPEPAAPPEAAAPSPWVWALGGLSTSTFVTAVLLAARAASLDPGDDVATSATVGIDDLERDAAEAHRLAIAADVLAVVAAASALGTVVVALVPRDQDGVAELLIAPAGGAVRWRF
jgi:tetratricopeptide (TPR) repeat protein